jgi:hypothetical protein
MIPRIEIIKTTFCDDEGEAEGRVLSVRWGRWVFEFGFGRHPR